MRYQNKINQETINTPLLNLNHKKLPRRKQSNKTDTQNIHRSYFISRIYYWFYYLLEKLFPCCNKHQEEHICYFSDLEDRITIQHNYMIGEKCHPFIFWDEPYEEEVFFDEDEQKIINVMKEKIKKYQ